MHKVVVERPRAGGGRDKKHRIANLDLDLLPRAEGIRRPYRSRKHFTDLLGPLRRWLRAQVGRPWNDVYSEASAVITADSVVRAHIRTHLFEMVERHTIMRDGAVRCLDRRWSRRGEIPIAEQRTLHDPFYVHPETGLLCVIPQRTKRRTRTTVEQRLRSTCRWLGGTEALVRIKGTWFSCTMKLFPARPQRGDSPLLFDLNHRNLICRTAAEARYGRPAVCVAKKQLSRRELQQFGLTNLDGALLQSPGRGR